MKCHCDLFKYFLNEQCNICKHYSKLNSKFPNHNEEPCKSCDMGEVNAWEPNIERMKQIIEEDEK